MVNVYKCQTCDFTLSLALTFQAHLISKVKLFLCFFKPSTTPLRRIGGLEVQLRSFLTSTLDGDEWSDS
jgi:hypothetical protein